MIFLFLEIIYENFCVFLCLACLLATQLNYLSEENLLVPNCVCLLKKTINNTLADGRYVLSLYFLSSFVYSCFPIWYNFHFAPFFCSRRVVVVMDMDILKSAKETGGKIGNPTPYNTDGIVLLKCAWMKVRNCNKQPLEAPYGVCSSFR